MTAGMVTGWCATTVCGGLPTTCHSTQTTETHTSWGEVSTVCDTVILTLVFSSMLHCVRHRRSLTSRRPPKPALCLPVPHRQKPDEVDHRCGYQGDRGRRAWWCQLLIWTRCNDQPSAMTRGAEGRCRQQTQTSGADDKCRQQVQTAGVDNRRHG